MVAWIKTTIIKSHTPYIASAHTFNTQRTHFQHRRRSAAVTCERCSDVSVWAFGCEQTHSFRFFTPFASMSGGRLHKLWEIKGLHTRKGGFIYVDRAAEKQTYFPTLLQDHKTEKASAWPWLSSSPVNHLSWTTITLLPSHTSFVL